MKPKTKLLTFLIVLTIAAQACLFGGDILFKDNFSNPDSGWDRYTYTNGFTDYEDGAYKIAINMNNQLYWATPYQSFGDVIIEVEVQKVEGGDNMQYGIICRQKNIENWYALVVSADGFAAIRKLYEANLGYIEDWVVAESLNTGNETNLLRAECVEDRLALYVNDELVIEGYDSDLTEGDAGVIAGTFAQPRAEVLFDNFVVRKPSEEN